MSEAISVVGKLSEDENTGWQQTCLVDAGGELSKGFESVTARYGTYLTRHLHMSYL